MVACGERQKRVMNMTVAWLTGYLEGAAITRLSEARGQWKAETETLPGVDGFVVLFASGRRVVVRIAEETVEEAK